MRKNTDKKSGWEEIKNDFNRNYFFCLFAWLLICLLFSKPINQLLGKLGGFLFSPDSTPPKSNEWLLIILLISMYVVRFYFRKRITDFSLRILYLITPLVLWVCLNLLFDLYPSIKFTKSTLFSPIPQIAILLVVSFVELLILILNYFKAEKLPRENKSSFITDVAFDPKKQKQKDELGFEPFANRIASEIKVVSSSESVVFGINGEWGEGKTSMINLIRQQLEDEKYTVVDFHPWKTYSGKAMNQLFFDALKDGLKNTILWGINWQIDRYANALLQLDKTGVGKVIWQFISQPDSVEKQKKKLAESMKLLDKNLVVVVDDLDRLAKNEIADVLKLMRDTANFPNLVFLAAYDRAYLNEAIKSEINPHNYANYMDKIVLWEAPIYRPQPRKYLEVLKNLLIDKLGDFSNEIENILSNELKIGSGVYDYLKESDIELSQSNIEVYSRIFVNLRTVKRFVNDFVFNFKNTIKDTEKVQSSVDFGDFFHLSLIRHFYPKHYLAFKNAFFSINSGNRPQIENHGKEYWKILITNSELKNDPQTPVVMRIISTLISTKQGVPEMKCFSVFWNFLEYFHFGNYDNVPLSDLASYLEADTFELFKEKVYSFAEGGKFRKVSDGKIVFENDMIIFAYHDKYNQINSADAAFLYCQQLVWLSTIVDYGDFYDKTHERLQKLMTSKLEKGNLKDKLYEFIKKERIEENIQSLICHIIYDFKTDFERLARQKGEEEIFYLKIDKAIEIAQQNFKTHQEKATNITSETISLFYCSYQKWNGSSLENDPGIIESMRDLANKHPNDFAKYLIEKYLLLLDQPNSESYSWVYFLLSIFNDQNDLDSFLKIEPVDDRRKVLLKYTKDAKFDAKDELDRKQIQFENNDRDLFYDSSKMKDLKYHI